MMAERKARAAAADPDEQPAEVDPPLSGKASANAKQAKLDAAEPPAPEPRRRERTVDGVRYVLVNGGWQRSERAS